MYDFSQFIDPGVTIICALALFFLGQREFIKQKKHEFKLEIAKSLFQHRWVLVSANKPDTAAFSEFNRALGAVQLAFADDVEISELLSAFNSANAGVAKDKILVSILEKVSDSVGLKVDSCKASICLAHPLPDEVCTTNTNIYSLVNNMVVSPPHNHS